jgi:hypothetical protein
MLQIFIQRQKLEKGKKEIPFFHYPLSQCQCQWQHHRYLNKIYAHGILVGKKSSSNRECSRSRCKSRYADIHGRQGRKANKAGGSKRQAGQKGRWASQ